MAHFHQFTRDPVQLRDIYNILTNALKRQDVTAILLDERANIFQEGQRRLAPLPFLVDNVVLLRYVEVDSSIQRAIAVMKMRGSDHEKEIRSYEIEEGGIKLGAPFSGQAGILSGDPYRIAAS